MTSPLSPPAWPGPDPDQIAPWNLVQAGHLIGRRFHREFAQVGLTPTQFGVLLQLDLHPEMSNNQIARSVLVTPQTMSELLDSLENLDLIRRDAARRGHRVPVRLTGAGRQRLQQCSAGIDLVQQSLGLSQQQHDDLNRILAVILAS